MPTIILFDVSLSMSRNVSDTSEEYQRRHLAIHGINTMLDNLAIHNKLEFVSLVVFSSLWEQVVGFTRDYDSIKTGLNKLEEYDKTCLMQALGGVSGLFLDEWGSSAACQIILVTDGNPGTGSGSLQRVLQDYTKQSQSVSHAENPRVYFKKSTDFPLPMPFHCKLHILCIAGQTESCLQDALPLYQKLIDINGYGGEIFIPDGGITLKSSQAMFNKLTESYYAPCYGTLKCGHLMAKIQIFPAPEEFKKERDFESICKTISRDAEIFGFLHIADIASPPVLSRHLILPKPLSSSGDKDKNDEKDDEDEKDDGKTPSFTVLLHGSLKVESMVALVTLGKEWFGVMYAWADSKKKSNLMLSIFEPGSDVIPWLGNLKHLAPVSDFADNPYEDNTTPFPVRQERRSYAQNSTVWIRAAGLQADVQKILRHARKLPVKQQHFYRELNRLRRMALSLGFVELLDAMSAMLERECTLLPGTAHPDAALQLMHAGSAIRSNSSKDIAQNIMPLRTNFSTDD